MFYHVNVAESATGRHLVRLGPFVADEVVDVARRVVLDSIPDAEDVLVFDVSPDGGIARKAAPDARFLAWKANGQRAVIVHCPGIPPIAFDSDAVAREAVGLGGG